MLNLDQEITTLNKLSPKLSHLNGSLVLKNKDLTHQITTVLDPVTMSQSLRLNLKVLQATELGQVKGMISLIVEVGVNKSLALVIIHPHTV